MRRRRSIAPLVFLCVGVLLLIAAVVTFIVWMKPDSEFSKTVIQHLRQLEPDEDWLNKLGKVGGVLGGAIGTAFTLLAGWHFLEMNLPRRIDELMNYHTRDHLALRPQFLEIAQGRLRFIPADIETSRLTLLRSWLGGWSFREQTRLLAATSVRLGQQASALSAAAKQAQHRQITAHLVRGYQHAFHADRESAFEEFEAAVRVRSDDVLSRDIAAGWARCIDNQAREIHLLREIQTITSGPHSYIDQARAFRREAELVARRNNDSARSEALELLRNARNLLEPVAAPNTEASRELGRVLTLFCEVRCDKGTPGRLNGPNQPLTRLRQYMSGVAMSRRAEEPCGEEYGEQRASRVEGRVAELLGEGEVAGEEN
jgi:hypothetical protein